MKFINLATINAAGTSTKALYSALATEMFFGQLSSNKIKCDQALTAPYLSVPLIELFSLDQALKKLILAEQCLASAAIALDELANDMSISAIEQLVISTSLIGQSNARSDVEQAEQLQEIKLTWQNSVTELVGQVLPAFASKIVFSYADENYADENALNTPLFENEKQPEAPFILLCVEALTEYRQVSQLNNSMDILCQGSAAGVMPAEAASCSLVMPKDYPLSTQQPVLSIEAAPTDIPLHSQLSHLGFGLPNTVIHTGTYSEPWVKHWYSQTVKFFHPQIAATNGSQGKSRQQYQTEEFIEVDHVSAQTSDVELTVLEQNKTLGYLGAVNLSMAFSSAVAWLLSPMNQLTNLWVVEYQLNTKTSLRRNQVYKVCLSNTASP
ncbi:hypothetical protein DXX93_08700 [Thalassotalea euphylliae]|uniref:Uncharacterized protein n=1 Tax=Thalassotalea euphylliae TaxID=1655234 RepID=A0A3E0TQN7_9GAMM|nr:hypothetical protein [Thalassotalea euphylliae]REL26650.1 hypothetical protein DXX93_08700 [Thalassotalea euphylliae]